MVNISETRVTSTPVHPSSQRVDEKKHQTGRRNLIFVHPSTPIWNLKDSREESETHATMSNIIVKRNRGGRLDDDPALPLVSCDYFRPPLRSEGGQGGHYSGEVTL